MNAAFWRSWLSSRLSILQSRQKVFIRSASATSSPHLPTTTTTSSSSSSTSPVEGIAAVATPKRLRKVATSWEYSAGGAPPSSPTNCCGVGCVDCVWITHWKQMNEFSARERERQGLPPLLAPAYEVPSPAPGGAGRGLTAADVCFQERRLTGSTSGYKSARDR